MSEIKILSPHVADLIAAGEVVERPGSVVKELLENALDAGASALTVEIKNGGMSYIRVADNGCGISSGDVETAFLRHATSKIYDARDLETISTLGFRGEALAAIASVSRIDLLTKARGEESGTALSLEGGSVKDKSPTGCPDGTTMIVRDLFYNTPARMKFIKRDSAESANVHAVVQRIALSHPGVSFKFIKDGGEALHSPGDGKLNSCIYSIFGRDFARDLIEIKGRAETEGISISGFATRPDSSRGNRAYQHFFVNGRHIKSGVMSAALEEAYKNRLMSGRFPGCVLHLDIGPGSVDVNVHPTKTEVKFLNEKDVFRAVYYAVMSALGEDTAVPEIKQSPLPHDALRSGTAAETSGKEFFKTMPASRFHEKYNAGHPSVGFKTSVAPAPPEKSRMQPLRDGMRPAYENSPPVNAEQSAPPQPAAPQGTDWRIIGEALGTYIIVEKSDGLLLIDKHAAHERIIFDRLHKGQAEVMPQVLLSPVIASPGREESAALLENLPLLTDLGFDIEDFGGGAIAVRQVPSGIDCGEIEPLLSELARRLSDGRTAGPENLSEGLMETIACKAAIKAGRRSRPEELTVLVEQVMSGKIRHCPHGRPVSVFMSKAALDKGFGRT